MRVDACQACHYLVKVRRWYDEGTTGTIAKHNDANTGRECKGTGAPSAKAVLP